LKNLKRKEKAQANLVNSTSSLIMNFVYMLTICWVAPVAPMIITWILDLPFTSFMIVWASGLPFLSLSWYYFFKTVEKKK